jgi:hypothetical protein
MKPKKTLSAYVLIIGIMTLLAVGSLLSFQIYSALTKSQISQLQQKAIKPLDGNIREEVIKNLVGRRWFNRTEIDRPLVVVDYQVADSPTATESGQVVNSPSATETGKVVEE